MLIPPRKPTWMNAVGVLFVILFAVSTSPVAAQTPSDVCALDSLRLVSPDGEFFDVDLVLEPRFGALLSWRDLDDATTTCSVAVDTADLDIVVDVQGAFSDVLDRELRFVSNYGGTVGSDDTDAVKFQWNNVNQQFTGRIAGEVNLSNNGGLLAQSGGAWTQINAGLPQYMSTTDCVGFTASPVTAGRFATALEGRLFRGLWYKPAPDLDWRRVGEDVFPDQSTEALAITAIAFSPVQDETFVVGTTNEGVFLTEDGGTTFRQVKYEFADDTAWSQRSITALDWGREGALYVAVRNVGLFVSEDGGDTFRELDSLVLTVGGLNVPPSINDIATPTAARILVAIENYGLYESTDAGVSWDWRYTQALTGQAVSATCVVVDPVDSAAMLIGTRNYGLLRTLDGGNLWEQVEYFADPAAGADDPFLAGPTIADLAWDERNSRFVAAVDLEGVMVSGDGADWALGAQQPGIRNYTRLVAGAPGVEDLLLASSGGGIYVPGTPLDLNDTVMLNLTDFDYQDIDFGLSIAFSVGELDTLDAFSLVMQDFQGYAVWRSEIASPMELELIGLYNKNNPESCIQGYCGSASYNTLPNCYADKRAACFDFREPGVIKFFDDSIYDGFVYYYAVTTFDYGNTATVSPTSLSSDQLFSPRYQDDLLSIFGGDGNYREFRVNYDANTDFTGDEEIFVVPNPLRNTSHGFTQPQEGQEVEFRNLPAGSRVLVFTLDGDLVADLGPEEQEGHNRSWITQNADGELLGSGVYIYKVEMEDFEDFYGKLVIIR